MPSSFGNGTVRVTAPTSYAVQHVGRSRDRALEPPSENAATTDVLVRALEQSEMSLVDRVDLAPRQTKDLGKPVPNRKGTVKVDVDVPAGEDAVVLLERDGVYSWHLPVNPIERTKDLDPRAAHGALRDRRAAPRLRDQRTPAAARRDRGLLGGLVQGAATALVFKFVAPPLVKKAVEHAEAHVRTGLVHLTAAKVSAWRPFENLDELEPADRPAGARPAVRPRHLLLDGRGLRGAGGREGRQGLPPYGDRGVRRGHRLRPHDPQRRPTSRTPKTC